MWIPFANNSPVKPWDSYDKAKHKLGDVYLYPQLPSWAESDEYEIKAYSYYTGRWGRNNFYKFILYISRVHSATEHDIQYGVSFYACDLSKRESGERMPDWQDSAVFNKNIDGIDVSYVIEPLKAWARFNIDNIEYGFFIYLHLSIDQEDNQIYEDKIWDDLDFMIRSIISQKKIL